MSWTVYVHPKADLELASIPGREEEAMRHAIEKLEVLGPGLPFPHSSAVKDADRLRELRPRAGRSPWRGFYRQVTETAFVVAAIGPEANVNPRRFKRAIQVAEQRLAQVEAD